MAVTKVSGFRRSTQLVPEGSPSETPPPSSRHVRVFETIANLNRRFDLVLTDVERLKQFGLFRGKFPSRFAKTCRLTIEETRAWAIFVVTGHIYQCAEEDSSRFGRMLREWENKFKDPNDVLIEAEPLGKPRKRRAQKREGSGACQMKAEVYAHLHAFSSAFEQAWDAAQKLQPHLELGRDEMKRIYFRLQQARLETLVVLNELGAGYERTCEHRIRKQKAQWETQEAERLRKRDEAEKARWAWEKRNKKSQKRRDA